MGMKDIPGCGYLVAAIELIPALPHEHRAKAEALLEDCDLEAIQELSSGASSAHSSLSCRSLRPWP